MPEQTLAMQEPKQERAPVAMSTRGVQFSNFDELGRFCVAIVKSRLAPKGFETPESVMVAIQMGMEIGLAPMQALQNIALINNRPSVWGDAALALVKAHPDCEDVIETIGDEAATCEVHRKGKLPVKRTFNVADAKKAGLWGKAGPWTNYPKRMLQMRARSWALRDQFPDVLKGVRIAEEQIDVPPTKQANAREVTEKIVFPDEVAQIEAPKSVAEEPEREPTQEEIDAKIAGEDFFK